MTREVAVAVATEKGGGRQAAGLLIPNVKKRSGEECTYFSHAVIVGPYMLDRRPRVLEDKELCFLSELPLGGEEGVVLSVLVS